MTRYNFKRKGLRPLPALLLAGALTLPMAACDTDELVAVEDPAQLRPEDLNNAAAVPALVNGAFRQFVGGYSGFGDDSFLSSSAVITDEAYYGDTFTTREAADKRNLQAPVLTNISDPAFIRLQQARFNARRAFAVVEQFTLPATAAADSISRARLRSIEAYVYVTLSEGWCGAVPFSRIPDTGAIDPTGIQGGTPLTTPQMNDTAVARFNEALAFAPTFTATASATSAIANERRLASIGKARALLNLGKYVEAAAAVPASVVPTGYVFRLEHSANVAAENNPIFQLEGNGRYGVSNLEGGVTATGVAFRPDAGSPQPTGTGNLSALPATSAIGAEGVAFRGLLDPRVPFQGRAATNFACFSGTITCWINNNYPTNDSDVPLASGVEARLIEAEAALFTGRTDDMLAILNNLRSQVATLLPILYRDQRQQFGTTVFASPTLPALADPATAEMTAAEASTARRNMLFQERALWLYNTGHRQGDLRRLIREYKVTGPVFPTGPHFRGGTYGNDVAYPVPFDEQNNTNYSASACVTTQA